MIILLRHSPVYGAHCAGQMHICQAYAYVVALNLNALYLQACLMLIDQVMDIVVSMHARMQSTERKEETLQLWASQKAKMQEAAVMGQVQSPTTKLALTFVLLWSRCIEASVSISHRSV